MEDRADVVVIGMGPGGEEVAGRLADAGLDVVGVEAGLVGGECPYWGCIPSKMLVRAADLVAESGRGAELAGSVPGSPDWGAVARRVRAATDDWDDAAAVKRFGRRGGRLRRGYGRLDGPGRVVVDGVTIGATRAVVLATGTRPTVPPIPGLADTPFWTNREAIAAGSPPASLIVLGGGAIGIELAQVFRRFGTEVTVVEAAPRLVAREEPEASELIAGVLEDEGVVLRLSAEIRSVYHDGDRFTLMLAGEDALTAERLLVATGRNADLTTLGLPSVGLDGSAAAVPVDDRLRVVATDRMWAVGDLTGKGAFTHTAMYQADIAVRDILGQPGPRADYRAMPRVTFSDPEIGASGLTEQEARDAGRPVRTAVVDLADSARGWIHGPGTRGLIKLVEDRDRGVLIGATSVGPSGGEVLGLLALAIHAAVPVDRLEDMICAYPTFHRAVQDAVRNLSPT
jgi:pyruvate/2-oxoglutarate dehydrogenase complex dihydrolipoamide dehydrogenase (E3) component